MEASPQVLSPRQPQPGGKRVNPREILRRNVSDQHVWHEPRISGDISTARLRPGPKGPPLHGLYATRFSPSERNPRNRGGFVVLGRGELGRVRRRGSTREYRPRLERCAPRGGLSECLDLLALLITAALAPMLAGPRRRRTGRRSPHPLATGPVHVNRRPPRAPSPQTRYGWRSWLSLALNEGTSGPSR